MVNFIKKIWDEKADESVHQQFVRFGKGEYKQKAVLNVRRGGSIKVNATYEMTNDLVHFVADNSKKIKAKGIVLSKQLLPFPGKSTAKGTYSYNVDNEFSSEELKDLLKKCYYALLDCEGDGLSLKVKKTLPRPSTKGEGKVKDKFCVLSAEEKHWGRLKEDLLFGLPEGKRYEIKHSYLIEKIVLPSGEKDPEQIRLKSKRKGKIVRKAVVDGKEISLEKEFEE